MSPQWLNKNDIIQEDSTNFINTPDFSLFESKTYSVIVDRKRFQVNIRSNERSRDELDSIAKIAKKYVMLLNQVPYTSMGLNFTWSMKAKEPGAIPMIDVKVGSNDGLQKSLETHELSYGCIINARKGPYLLKLTIAPPQDDITLVYNFNYHYELKDLDVGKICEYIDDYVNLFEHSKGVVEMVTY